MYYVALGVIAAGILLRKMQRFTYFYSNKILFGLTRQNSQSLTGGYSRLWHRVVVPARQPMCSLAISPQSVTKNLAPELDAASTNGETELI